MSDFSSVRQDPIPCPPRRARPFLRLKVMTGRLPGHARCAPPNIFVDTARRQAASHHRFRGARGAEQVNFALLTLIAAA